MNPILTRVEKDGADKLALRFPSSALRGAGAALSAAMNEPGFLVRPGAASAECWRFESVAQEGEGAFLLGAAFEGASLDDRQGLREGMGALLAVARALAALSVQGSLPRGLVSSGILLSKAGGAEGAVLVLPPAIVAKALSARGPEARASAVARLASPASKGPEADASFFLAQAAYRYATGKGAFEREASEPGITAGSVRDSAPAVLAAPRLVPALASLVDAALDDPNAVGLGDWVAALETAAVAGWERELSPEEEAELSRRLGAREAEAEKRRRRATFFRKRGALLAGICVALVVAGFVAADILRAQRSRPDYSALPPLDLVRQYYAALDGLDLESLEACGEKEAIKADRDVVMNLMVLTRTRMAYEGRNPLLPARDWAAAGKRSLRETDFLYGIVGLDIVEAPGGNDASRRFRASYSIWSLESVEDPSGDPSKARSQPKEQKRVDELRLERGKKGWRIASIERQVTP